MADLTELGVKIFKEKPNVVSFVGAGGKSSLMLALATEIHNHLDAKPRERIIISSTTNMSADEIPSHVKKIQWNGDDDINPVLTSSDAENKIPLLFRLEERGKLRGFDPDAMKKLIPLARTVFLEADGARRHPFKRLRSHEPVIPDAPPPSLVCIVASLEVLASPLDEDTCFNLAGVVQDGIANENTTFSPRLMRDILFHPRGYLDVIPEGHEAVLLLNKSDRFGDIPFLEGVARSMYHRKLSKIYLTTAKPGPFLTKEVTNAADRIFGIIFAGGKSTRFGRLKQIEPVDKSCLLGIVIQNSLMCDELEKLILVVGHEHARIQEALSSLIDHGKIDIVVNRDYEEGLSSSLRAGLSRAREAGCDAVSFIHGDMPFIDTQTLNTVLSHYRSSCSALCYASTGERFGHPVVVRREWFHEFMAIEGDVGGRDIIRNNMEHALAVDVGDQDGMSQFDINTPEDMETFLSLRRKRDES